MDDTVEHARDARDLCYDLNEAIYGTLPSRATHEVVRRSRASSPSPKKVLPSPKSTFILKRPERAPASWLSPPRKRHQAQRIEIHQSTCLNLNMAADGTTESDLWILPDFDDWELTDEKTASTHEWALYLRRAAKSNLERLRARLEGDGWAFVGGKYEEDRKVLQEEASHSEESVDEEFDVVILPAVHASC